jgi:hypothetical protein
LLVLDLDPQLFGVEMSQRGDPRKLAGLWKSRGHRKSSLADDFVFV